MTNRKEIDEMKKYLDELDIDIEVLDVDKYKEIGADCFPLAKEFIRLFNEFRNNFKDCELDFVKKIIENDEKHGLFLVRKIAEHKSSNLGTPRIEKQIENYICENYYDIIDSFSIFSGVYSE